ncbi:hypothetical protein T05_6242 [Trichinella murrelli]|uniref:PiggyBac transposable element-derived protein domain-containing protein n=1 Tax=Trichinella murrelli TaxID=144512 RepID=A0A0V0T6Q5_9BILA|nr:hypothetical protein T05_6242 [Trichinella murrelli]
MLITMAVSEMPRYRMYWANQTRMDTVANCMSRNRFETLLRFLHFNDNDKFTIHAIVASKLVPIVCCYVRLKILANKTSINKAAVLGKLPDPDVSEPDTVSEDELDRTFQQSNSSSDDEVIEEDDASANARRKSYIWRRRPFTPKTEPFINK